METRENIGKCRKKKHQDKQRKIIFYANPRISTIRPISTSLPHSEHLWRVTFSNQKGKRQLLKAKAFWTALLEHRVLVSDTPTASCTPAFWGKDDCFQHNTMGHHGFKYLPFVKYQYFSLSDTKYIALNPSKHRKDAHTVLNSHFSAADRACERQKVPAQSWGTSVKAQSNYLALAWICPIPSCHSDFSSFLIV